MNKYVIVKRKSKTVTNYNILISVLEDGKQIIEAHFKNSTPDEEIKDWVKILLTKYF